MSFTISDTSSVFSTPFAVPIPETGNRTDFVISTSPTSGLQIDGTQLSGGTTYTLAAIPAGQTGNLVVSGPGTLVNLNTGSLNATIIGGGGMIEAAPTGTISKTIMLSSENGTGFNKAAVVPLQTSLIGGTIQSALGNIPIPAPPQGGVDGQINSGFSFYAHSGAGNDQIEGSAQNDFIRGGAGNDAINGFGGNDVIRGGSGNDTITGGAGNDTLYYTSDQLDGSTDRFTDFNDNGSDVIAVAKTSVASIAGITGFGSNTLTFIVSQTKVVSGDQYNFKEADITFV